MKRVSDTAEALKKRRDDMIAKKQRLIKLKRDKVLKTLMGKRKAHKVAELKEKFRKEKEEDELRKKKEKKLIPSLEQFWEAKYPERTYY
jgi:hypothetical protein